MSWRRKERKEALLFLKKKKQKDFCEFGPGARVAPSRSPHLDAGPAAKTMHTESTQATRYPTWSPTLVNDCLNWLPGLQVLPNAGYVEGQLHFYGVTE